MDHTLNKRIKTLFKLLFKEPKVLRALLSLRHVGYLNDIGWFQSFKSQSSVGTNYEPLPWLTYPFIDFIVPRLNKNLILFEYGGGNSTYFFSKYINKSITVEHNKKWYYKLKSNLPQNSEIFFKDVNTPEYEQAIIMTNNKFDIILIDAEKRVECIKFSLKKLNEFGVIILDDSDREEYASAFPLMHDNGYKHLDFWGISPGYLNRKATTVFYKEKNCLGI